MMDFKERIIGFDDAIADSLKEFGSNCSSNWSYHVAEILPNDRIGDVGQCNQYAKLQRVSTAYPDVGLGKDTQNTVAIRGHQYAAMRRWKSTVNSSVRIVGWLQKSRGDKSEVVFKIYRDHQLVWSKQCSADDFIPHAFDVAVYDLTVGAKLDFIAYSPKSSKLTTVNWKMQIVTEACTAWNPGYPVGPQFTDAEKQQQRTDGKRLLQQIKEASDRQLQKFRIPPGNYRFRAGWDPDCPIIEGIHDLNIEAEGVTFWMEPPLIWGLLVRKCRNVVFHGLTIDFDPLPFFQAKVVSVDAVHNKVTAEMMPGYEALNADGVVENAGQRVMLFFKPDGLFINNYLLGKSWRRIDRNLIEIETEAPDVVPGCYVAAPLRTGAALRSIECEHIEYVDCNVYASGGMMVMEGGGRGGNVYRRLHGIRRPKTNRLHAFGADGFHMTATEKGPLIDRCEVAHLADDHINLHGFFGIVSGSSDGRYYFAGSYSPFRVNTKVDFWDWKSIEHIGSATISSAKRVTDTKIAEQILANLDQMSHAHSNELWEIILDQALNLPVGTLIDTHTLNCEGYVVRNCWFHDCFNRPFLLNGASGGRVENNTFSNVMHGIEIHYETWGPMTEGQFPNNNTFENNRMIGCSLGKASSDAYFQGAVMSVMVPSGGNYLRRSMPIHNMSFKSNYIEQPGGVPFYATNIDGLVIENNIIDRPFNAGNWSGFTSPIAAVCGDIPDGAVFLAAVKNAVIRGNLIYDPKHRCMSESVTGPLTSHVTVNGRKQPDCIADFVSGWSHDGIQGDHDWKYGFVDTESLRTGYAASDAFQLILYFDQGKWVYSLNYQFPQMTMLSMHPAANRAAVKRWISTYAGTAMVDGTVIYNGRGDGIRIHLFVDGVRRWSQVVKGSNPYKLHRPTGRLSKGSRVDIIVDALGTMSDDSTQIYIKIMAEA